MASKEKCCFSTKKQRLLQKHREFIAYGIVGCISVADSIFWFWFFVTPLMMPYMFANALAWFVDIWIVFVYWPPETGPLAKQ